MDFNLRLIYFWLYLCIGFTNFVYNFVFMGMVFIVGVALIYWPIFVVIFYSHYYILNSRHRPALHDAFIRPQYYVKYFWNQYNFLVARDKYYQKREEKNKLLQKKDRQEVKQEEKVVKNNSSKIV